jgi:hypothetical protein
MSNLVGAAIGAGAALSAASVVNYLGHRKAEKEADDNNMGAVGYIILPWMAEWGSGAVTLAAAGLTALFAPSLRPAATVAAGVGVGLIAAPFAHQVVADLVD